MKKHVLTKKEQKAIDDIMQTFNFVKVRNFMKKAKYGWYVDDNGGYVVPDVKELKAHAERLMRQTLERNVSSFYAGGFYVINCPGLLQLVYEYETALAPK